MADEHDPLEAGSTTNRIAFVVPASEAFLFEQSSSLLAGFLTPPVRDEDLTPEQLAERIERRALLAAEDALKVKALRDLHEELTLYARRRGGVLGCLIEHHLPELTVENLETARWGWACPGCDHGYDEGGVFPCSSIRVVQAARGIRLVPLLRDDR